MSDTVESLRRKIGQARTLGSVVRTMKTLAAISIRQYEEAVNSLEDYARTIELGLSACLRHPAGTTDRGHHGEDDALRVIVVVFGSDQGLVGQFNDRIAATAAAALGQTGARRAVLAIGERMQLRLKEDGIETAGLFTVPNSVSAITLLVGDLLSAVERLRGHDQVFELHLTYNTPVSGEICKPISKRLLPLDRAWEAEILRAAGPWPTRALPELPNGLGTSRWALLREYIFVSIFRACAESLASENASRLSAMQRAEKNIDELTGKFTLRYNELRQAGIDEELFDIVSGFQALGSTQGADEW
ncbi:MAG: F0F1 ATP synthase subunit gamma [Chlorobiaceae bacterium]|nr:F0F1 ATP synthase subunit gamma [Chlorobiaceae bacterium]